ncbi:serine/arginine repetitive matrix protein 3-like [Nycticebus coucang]|uniref:serine/arginine repetitive matrix protein 3-like n=1 Tax=Nycticebus coucang TaxID=9470 RepID=UPI00234C4628|nr:serine/arginine repetitive matrix protein 3-like [Nycticebus coucang]
MAGRALQMVPSLMVAAARPGVPAPESARPFLPRESRSRGRPFPGARADSRREPVSSAALRGGASSRRPSAARRAPPSPDAGSGGSGAGRTPPFPDFSGYVSGGLRRKRGQAELLPAQTSPAPATAAANSGGSRAGRARGLRPGSTPRRAAHAEAWGARAVGNAARRRAFCLLSAPQSQPPSLEKFSFWESPSFPPVGRFRLASPGDSPLGPSLSGFSKPPGMCSERLKNNLERFHPSDSRDYGSLLPRLYSNSGPQTVFLLQPPKGLGLETHRSWMNPLYFIDIHLD